MKQLVLSLIAILLLSNLAFSGDDPTPPTSNPRDAFLNAGFLKLIRFDHLPAEVRRSLLDRLRRREPNFASHMADPGQEFNRTDVVDTTVPMRRLVFAGAAPELWFVYYEHGGRGFHYHLLMYVKGRVEPIFAGRFVTRYVNGRIEEPPASIDDLKTWLTTGRIDNDAVQNNDW